MSHSLFDNSASWTLPRLSKKIALCSSCISGIEDLGWSSGLTFSCYGSKIGIRTNNPALMPKIIAHLPPHSRPISQPTVEFVHSILDGGQMAQAANSRIRRFHLMYLNSTRLVRTHDLDSIFEHLEFSLHSLVAMDAPKKNFIRGGVVGWKGQAILILGSSLDERKELIAQLMRAGATYYSDTYAVVDEKGRVHPFARPFDGVEMTETGNKPLAVGLIVLPKYEEGARWRPREIPQKQGLQRLMDNAIVPKNRPDEAQAYLSALVRNARILRGKFDRADEITASLLA